MKLASLHHGGGGVHLQVRLRLLKNFKRKYGVDPPHQGGGTMESLRKIERYFDLFERHRVFWNILILIFLEIPLQLYIRMHILSPWILNKTSFVSIHIQKFDKKNIIISNRETFAMKSHQYVEFATLFIEFFFKKTIQK